MRKITRTIALATVVLVGTVSAAHASRPNGTDMPQVGAELAAVRQATARYHRLDAALADGYVPFSIDPADPEHPTCFDHPDKGGMGVHYVKGIDGDLDPIAPEAMVYAVTDHGPQLVGVEYIVPDVLVDPADPPSLFGQELHHHSFLPVYVLHAWVWRDNPAGVFADFNPSIGACPTG